MQKANHDFQKNKKSCKNVPSAVKIKSRSYDFTF